VKDRKSTYFVEA